MSDICMHGKERCRQIPVNEGKTVYTRRERFCIRHGWIELVVVGGDIGWHRHHAGCDAITESGAFLPLPKVLKKAA